MAQGSASSDASSVSDEVLPVSAAVAAAARKARKGVALLLGAPLAMLAALTAAPIDAAAAAEPSDDLTTALVRSFSSRCWSALLRSL